MLYKNKISRTAIPGYSLIPKDDHYQVKKITLTAERVKTDPAFHRTRICAGDFAKAARLGRRIRNALLLHSSIKTTAPLLAGRLHIALRTSPSADPDFSTACFDNLLGYNFNPRVDWQQCTTIQPDVVANIHKNWITTRLPAFIPTEQLIPPGGITHCRIFTTVVAINCKEKEEAEIITKTTTLIPIKQMHIKPRHLTAELTHMKGRLIIVALGIHWYGPAGYKGAMIRKPPGPLTIIYIRHQ
ncbi:hypothetical protein D3H65_20315 [Paraflavitalea soli]|uniref:Uncharacterized protein n=1 Tax=Paraflavitalea soli TaxID=2315862 RepID=A0A3B7MPW3_9BACT|nr:hypothetical protein [Paraflavitalea soli]AXY76188.1 hypothetical protein D3H65_20315 [Paraflavitalea soli]